MKRVITFLGLGILAVSPAVFAGACKAGSGLTASGGNGGSAAMGSGAASGTMSTGSSPTSTGTFGSSTASTGSGLMGDPTTCAEAAMYRTYLGCDFYPTVTGNVVEPIFDFAAVVANGGMQPATVTVTKGGAPVGQPITVQPNALAAVYLPWVNELKGNSECSLQPPLSQTVNSPQGAYHLVSSVPVTVYQFNALEYAGKGGPSPTKDWATLCASASCSGLGCFSFTNDASLLLPTTAMTNNYRVTGYPSWNGQAQIGSTLTVTGTQNGTNVTVTLSPSGGIVGGGGIPTLAGGQKAQFTLNAGQVVELVGPVPSDFSGSLVQSDKPVQVISGVICTQAPNGVPACDHIEESVLPAETLGKHYVVTMPTGPHGQKAGAIVRMYGNVNQTHLTYPSGPVPGAPALLNAGQVVDMGVVNNDFEVSGDHEFAVATIMQGGSVVDSGAPTGSQEGDPSQSTAIAVEQWRTKYVFLAPTDYDFSYVDIAASAGATIMLDGAPISAGPQGVGASTFKVFRQTLTAGANNGAHILTSTVPFGIQVIGYGLYTSYQYPGGLNLDLIAPPPPPPM